MFQSFSIQNFRGIPRLKIEDLGQFNLILGKNNVGKTAFLEALFLLLGPTNPELPVRINFFRGVEQIRNEPEDLWGWLFFEKNMENVIRISGETREHKSRSLAISLRRPKEIRLSDKRRITISRSTSSSISSQDEPRELFLRYNDGEGGQHHTRSYVRENGLGFERGKPLVFPMSVMVSAKAGTHLENAERFSRLEEEGRGDSILPALQIIEPRLKRVSVLITGTGAILHGDIGLSKMIPLPMMGDGVGRMLALILAIADSKNGSVLVDEFDAGLHYSALVEAWRVVSKAARSNNVQLFATTHSWECIRAADEAFSMDAQPSFRAYRFDRRGNDIETVVFEKDMIDTALQLGMELR